MRDSQDREGLISFPTFAIAVAFILAVYPHMRTVEHYACCE